jgi:phospholipid/cholesterol/gamma-HCH transport system ATP-binding protein
LSIRFEKISKSFGSKCVLNQVSFEVARGEILFILGRSGMGKSVTLKHMIGLLKADSGQIFIDDQNVTQADANQLSQVRQKCGMVFQHPALLDSLTVFENISFGLKTPQFIKIRGAPMTAAEINTRVLEKLSLVNLSPETLDRLPSELSYGMQKRVSLARTLAPNPSYLLFDEPTTGLDPITTTAINDLIRDLSRKLQVTSLVVSHDMACALKIADRILVLDHGKILAHTHPAALKKSQEPLIRDFLSETLALLPPEERIEAFTEVCL